MNGKILVTGASGFIGRALCRHLSDRQIAFLGVSRSRCLTSDPYHTIEDYLTADWPRLLAGINTVVHLAGRAHIMREESKIPLAAYRAANVAVTEQLAKHAERAGVQCFVLVSTCKVHGEYTVGRAFCETDQPAPQDPYAISKWEAEQALTAHARTMRAVILRLPLVYGPGVKGNFLKLLHAIKRRYPFPLEGIANRRSLLYLGNLLSVFDAVFDQAHLAQLYLVSDGEDLTTPELISRLAVALEIRARLFTCPTSVLRVAVKLTGKQASFDRLCRSLQIDNHKLRKELNWHPPYTVGEGLTTTAQWYRETYVNKYNASPS